MSFRSQDINLLSWRASDIVLLKRSFDSKIDATGDDASSGCYNLSPSNINLTLNASGFSGH